MGRTKQTPRTGKKSKAYKKQQQQKKEQEEMQTSTESNTEMAQDQVQEHSGESEPSKDTQAESNSEQDASGNTEVDDSKSSSVDKSLDAAQPKIAGTKRKMQAADSSTGGGGGGGADTQPNDSDESGAPAGDDVKKAKLSDEDASKPVAQVSSSTEKTDVTGEAATGEQREDDGSGDEGPEDVSLAEGKEMAESKMKDESLQAQRSE